LTQTEHELLYTRCYLTPLPHPQLLVYSSLAATHEEAAGILKHSGETTELVAQYRPTEYHEFQAKFYDIMATKKAGSLTTTQMKSLYV